MQDHATKIVLHSCTEVVNSAECFIRTLKGKIYNKMAANDSKSYLGFFNKLVNEYNSSYHCSIGKKSIHAFYLTLTLEIESSHKAPKFKAGDRVRLNKYKSIFSKGYTQKWSKQIFMKMLKTNSLMYEI